MKAVVAGPSSEVALEAVAIHMRHSDIVEAQLSHAMSPHQAVYSSSASSLDEAALYDCMGVPLAVGGVALDGDEPRIWMLGTTRLNQVLDHLAGRRAFHWATLGLVESWLMEYGRLSNWVHASNRRSVRWLQAMGFEVAPPAPHGVMDAPFRFFLRERGN